MRFARAIWKLLVGVKDALVLIFMLMFFGLIYAGLSAKPTPVSDGVLALDLNGSSRRAAVQGRRFRSAGRRQPGCANIVSATSSPRSTVRGPTTA